MGNKGLKLCLELNGERRRRCGCLHLFDHGLVLDHWPNVVQNSRANSVQNASGNKLSCV